MGQVTRLIDNKVSVNAHDYDRRTGLHLAASEGRTEVVQYLLKARADASFQDRFGLSSLDDAIRHGHAGIKRLLYEAGARVSGIGNVLKACAASANGDPNAIELTKNLVDNGLDPKAGDYDGRTPLHLAACSGKLGLLEYFISTIQAGTNSAEADSEPESHFNVVDRYGYTPLDDAHRHGHAAAIVVLENAGAMRKGDARLDAFVDARRQRDTERQRNVMRAASAKYLLESPETKAWSYIRDTAIPAVHAVLEQLLESSRTAEELARRALPVVRRILDRYVRQELPREVALVRAKLMFCRLKQKRTGRRDSLNSAESARASPDVATAVDAFVLAGSKNSSVQKQPGDVSCDVPVQLPTRAELEHDIAALIRHIGEFLARDCAAARDVLGIDFTQCCSLRLASKGLVRELARLSAQLCRNAGILKLIRRVLKDVSTLCLSHHEPPPPPPQQRAQGAPLALVSQPPSRYGRSDTRDFRQALTGWEGRENAMFRVS